MILEFVTQEQGAVKHFVILEVLPCQEGAELVEVKSSHDF
jgi:hypothetical protein